MGQTLKFNTVSYAYGNSAWGDLLTNYNGTASSTSSSSSSLWGCEAKTWYELYNGELNLFDINASAQYADDYDRILRLSGDFTSCVEQIKNPSGEYNLFNNNCAQKSLTILASADTDCEYMLKRASEEWRPTSAHTSLEESISRNRMYASTAGHKSSLSQGGASGVRINFVMMVK